jgi:hypothetical protein
MSSTATLEYQATATGPTTPANLETAMAAVSLDENAIETITGCTLTSDTTTLAGAVATRTIVFAINTTQFEACFPAGTDQAAPFRGLYTQALSSGLNTFITEIPVVIA